MADWRKLELKGSFLDVPEVVQFTGCDSLYIREAYTELHDLINKAENEKMHVVITGTPGIGKSLFAVYVLYRALKEGRDVLFTPILLPFFFLQRGARLSQSHPPMQHFRSSMGTRYTCMMQGQSCTLNIIFTWGVLWFFRPRTKRITLTS